MMDAPAVEGIVRELLLALGEDPQRLGLQDTPKRVALSYAEILNGYDRDFSRETTVFPNDAGYNGIIIARRIDFTSVCEHHLLPFWGYASVAYLPDDKIIGISKLARAVDIFSRRLQDQERLTVQVAQTLMQTLKPKGVAVKLRASHMCNSIRGVNKKEFEMVTLIYRGIFETDQHLQNQFVSLLDE